ncbi:MAG: hypothetical protein V3T05_12055, partial [Myxococcota bacterium]
MNRAEFLSEYNRLQRDFEDEAPSVGCLNSTNLRSSAYCMFSDSLENCYRCTHCKNSVNCSNLSQSTGCDSCHGSAYL